MKYFILLRQEYFTQRTPFKSHVTCILLAAYVSTVYTWKCLYLLVYICTVPLFLSHFRLSAIMGWSFQEIWLFFKEGVAIFLRYLSTVHHDLRDSFAACFILLAILNICLVICLAKIYCCCSVCSVCRRQERQQPNILRESHQYSAVDCDRS